MAEAAPVIVTALMGKRDQRWANALRKAHFPPERNFLAAHITMFHHLPPGHWPEIAARMKAMARDYAAPHARLSEVMLLGRGVAYRVESQALMAMREELAHTLHGLLTPQDQGRPRLHITVQNKVDPQEAKALYRELSADFEPRALEICGLGAYYYRGGPWEGIGEYLFRGKAAPSGY